VIDDNKKQVFDAVEAAYRLHASGNTLNPDSYFLRYPDRPSARIIALPGHVGAVQKKRHQMDIEFPGKQGQQLLATSHGVIAKRFHTTGGKSPNMPEPLAICV